VTVTVEYHSSSRKRENVKQLKKNKDRLPLKTLEICWWYWHYRRRFSKISERR